MAKNALLIPEKPDKSDKDLYYPLLQIRYKNDIM